MKLKTILTYAVVAFAVWWITQQPHILPQAMAGTWHFIQSGARLIGNL